MESLEESIFKKSKRVVLKIGSAIIIGNNSNLINEKLLRGIVNEINKLHKMEKEVLLVSSGALALGKKNLKLINNLKLTEKQAAASIGQVLLINAWRKAFSKMKMNCGQILLTHMDAENRGSAINARNTIESLIKYKLL